MDVDACSLDVWRGRRFVARQCQGRAGKPELSRNGKYRCEQTQMPQGAVIQQSDTHHP
jgi:hypothetical protein